MAYLIWCVNDKTRTNIQPCGCNEFEELFAYIFSISPEFSRMYQFSIIIKKTPSAVSANADLKISIFSINNFSKTLIDMHLTHFLILCLTNNSITHQSVDQFYNNILYLIESPIGWPHSSAYRYRMMPVPFDFSWLRLANWILAFVMA